MRVWDVFIRLCYPENNARTGIYIYRTVTMFQEFLCINFFHSHTLGGRGHEYYLPQGLDSVQMRSPPLLSLPQASVG